MNRMACISKGEWKACMKYCKILQKERKLTPQAKFDCYRKHKVNIKHFGNEECGYSWNPSGNKDGYNRYYLDCLIRNKVPYSYKQACEW